MKTTYTTLLPSSCSKRLTGRLNSEKLCCISVYSSDHQEQKYYFRKQKAFIRLLLSFTSNPEIRHIKNSPSPEKENNQWFCKI